jgi:Ankyrin repeats (3 copies)
VLQVQLILNQVTKSGVRKALRQVSTKLEQLFGDTLIRIRGQPPELQDIALSALMWLSCSRRPLFISELQHAIATRFGEPQIDPEEDCPPLEVIVESCFGLVTIEHDESTIRLCHFSLQEYLDSQRKSLFPNAQTTMARICLTYLSYELPKAAHMENSVGQSDVSPEVVLKYLPFLRYSAEHWGYHAKAAAFDSIKTAALAFGMNFHQTMLAARVLTYLTPTSRRSHLERLIQIEDSDTDPEERIQSPSKEFACGLHLAASFDLTELLKCFLEHGLDVNSIDPFDKCNTALHTAASRGHLPSVMVLLDYNANLDESNADFNTPLFLAACGGHYGVAKA